jgi:hypothetical protein
LKACNDTPPPGFRGREPDNEHATTGMHPPRLRGHSLLLGSVDIGKRCWNHTCHSGVSRATVPAA